MPRGLRFLHGLLAALLLWSAGAFAADIKFPPLTGRVVDEARLLSAATEADLTTRLAAHEKATGQQVVVATVTSLQGQTIEDYGYQLGRAWGIGQKDKNTGAILLVAPNDRQVRIEVGYGLEGVLTDAQSRVIIERNILPAFRANEMEKGVVNGTLRMLAVLSGEAPPPKNDAQDQAQDDPGPIPLIVIILIFLLFMYIASRSPGGLLGFLLSSPSVWRGGGGGRSGGDMFGGGGGSFGGGGASGRW